jgi:CTP:phosphocholine cytidylyltransferase-like protein
MSEKPTIILLAGGRGTRLGELAKLIPKPLMDINGKPFIEKQVLRYAAEGYTNFIISIAYQGSKIKKHFETLNLTHLSITFVRDPKGVETKEQALHNLISNYVGYNGAWFINADTYIADTLPDTENHSHIALVCNDRDAGAQFISTRTNTQIKVHRVGMFIDIGTPESLNFLRLYDLSKSAS